jgi:DNA-directed RNA polymerase subunit M/transcription elongation factor TFIIS
MKLSTKKCNQCGSFLYVAGKKIEKIDNYSPITVTVYKCSNKECQDDIDKKTLARIKDTDDQKKAKEVRLQQKLKDAKIKKEDTLKKITPKKSSKK